MSRCKAHAAGFSLVELIAATALMAVVTTSSFMLVRTSHKAWLKHRDDSAIRQTAQGALQQMTRTIRQATHVTAISAAANTAGSLTVLMPDGTTRMWARDAGTNQIRYGTTAATDLLASGVTSATFIGLKADGMTTTTQVDLVHGVLFTVQYAISTPSGNVTETISSYAFLRAW
jgi:prepilin-type N-terminal cleavage/methylation domain-containing protein